MQARLTSSLIIVVVGFTSAVAGGPLFAVLLVVLGAAGFREYIGLASRVTAQPINGLAPIGYGVIAALGVAALYALGSTALLAIVTLAIAAPLLAIGFTATGESAFVGWALLTTGSLYLGLPIFAAVMLRALPGGTEPEFVPRAIDVLQFGWEPSPNGLGWATVVIVSTWIGDSAAFLAGRTFGRRNLAPRVSPNKTREGALAGLLAAAAVGAILFPTFGLGALWYGAVIGAIIGVCGQLGDLAESFLKRQAQVKDSGAVIPGHGGVLDRIDALLFAFPAGLFLASIDQWLNR